jgi:uncharacterized membrane protein HdeD (DUF308 family)
VLLALLGAVLVVKPFASLAVLIVLLTTALVLAGVGQLLRRDAARGRGGWVEPAAYLVAAVLVLLLPGETIRVVTVVVALALAVGGCADLAASAARQSSMASMPSSVSSAMRSRMCSMSCAGGGCQPVTSATTRSGSVVR